MAHQSKTTFQEELLEFKCYFFNRFAAPDRSVLAMLFFSRSTASTMSFHRAMGNGCCD
jgi:hypothetical protein